MRLDRTSLSILALAAVLLAPASARAQEEEGEDAKTGEEKKPDVDPLATAEKKDEAPKAAKPKNAPFSRIADDEETIYAVQRKAYLVNRKIEITPMVSASFGDRFVQTFAPAVSGTYHIAENFGLEAFFSYMFPSESGLTTEILDKGKLTPEIAKLTQLLWAGGLGVQWSPIYGKLQLAGSSLGNFNFYLGAGAGIGQTRVQCTPGLALDPNRGFPVQSGDTEPKCPMLEATGGQEDVFRVVYEPARLEFMGAFSAGIRFYFSDWLGLKFEVKDWVFATRVFRPGTQEPTQRFTDAIRNNLMAQLGVSFLLGGEE